MDDLARQLGSLRDAVRPEWDDERSERLYVGTLALGRRRRRQAVVLSVAGLLGVGLLTFGVVPRVLETRQGSSRGTHLAAQQQVKVVAPMAAAASVRIGPGQTRRLADGSLIEVASSQGELEVLHDAAMQVDLSLRSGVAHFDVVPNKTRHFLIDAGLVDVAVVGTVFDVERAGDRVRVAVTEGKVRVRGKDGETFVAAGESRWFGAAGAEPLVAPSPVEAQAMVDEDEHLEGAGPHAVHVHKVARREGLLRSSWRSLSQAGEYEAAYQALLQGSTVDNDPLALMDAADAARLSGHPAASVSYLRRVVREHRASPVAALAAFTLGRVLLESLGQPLEAADAFALSRALAPQGSLAQDALAREVEALSKGGSTQKAYQRAQTYVHSYPQGQRLRAVQLYGGIK